MDRGWFVAAILLLLRGVGYDGHDAVYHSMMMFTCLTRDTISALFGLNHGIIDPRQYSHLVATVIGGAAIPAAFMPWHLLPEEERQLGSPPTANRWGTWT